MLKRFGIPVLALATAMAVAAPSVTLAADRDDHRGGERSFAQQRNSRDRDDHRFDRDDHRDRDDRGRFNFGGAFYAPAPVVPVPLPAPAPAGYYDQFGIWHPYAY